MTQPDDDTSWMSPAYQADDVKLHVVDEPLTDEEARAWLAQTVAPAGDMATTIDTTEEVQGA